MEVENNFRSQLENAEKVTLIGPLFEGKITLPLDHPHIFVDKGGMFLPDGVKQQPDRPTFIRVGDGDSFQGELDVKLNPVKDLSDLSYALGMIPSTCKHLQLRGFLGGRKDHEIINLGEVYNYLSENQSADFDFQIFALGKGQYHFSYFGTFSLLSFIPNQVTLEGNISYPLKGDAVVPPLSSLGLSNEARGDFLIHAQENLLAFFNEVPGKSLKFN
jgi:thiamine pyrophosphokinase